jgi:DNA topoisomerase-1
MKSLILVESPAKCNKILSFLDDNYLCEATFGHLREIKSLKNINDNYDIAFENVPLKRKQIDKIKNKIKKVDEVILATDDDREGEGIAWHVIDMFNLPLKTKRIKFNSITKDAILNALNHPTTVDMNMVQSQQSRQILDLFVGYTISPILWENISRKNNLSAGRCQTPALNILYENYVKNQSSDPEMSYTTYGLFTGKNIKFNLTKNFKDETDVMKFLKTRNKDLYDLSHTLKTHIEKSPPKPFITSTLQQTCNNLYNMSPKECMSICQSLYEAGYITYMRTDSYYINDKFKEECSTYVTSKYGDKYNGNSIFKNKDSSQEAHEAIRPTSINTMPELSGKQEKIYKLIRNHTLKSLMANAIVNNYKFIASKNDDYDFTYLCDEIVFEGWMIIDGIERIDYISYLLNLKKVKADKIVCEPSFTNMVLHYSEAKLIKELEDKNIGRPSTFASIVEKLKERKYVIKSNVEGKKYKLNYYELCDDNINKVKREKVIGGEKNKLIIQPLGILVRDNLIKHFHEIFKYEFTEEMEKSLDLIAKGDKDKYNICDDLNSLLNDLINNYNRLEKPKMMIDDYHEFIIGKNGPVIKCTIDNQITFKKIIKGYDIEKIKEKMYLLDELLDKDDTERSIGAYKGHDIILKSGKYGLYMDYNGKNITLRSLEKEFKEIILSDVIDLLDHKESYIVREITNEISIRKGKYGDYIFYKTLNMKKPKFINLKKCDMDYLSCDKNTVIEYVNNNK